MTATAWSAPQPLALSPPPAPAVLAEILDGGQAFRWQREALPSTLRLARRNLGKGGSLGEGGPRPDTWLGIFDRFVVRLSFDASGALRWSTPALSTAEEPALSQAGGPTAPAAKTASALARYFDSARDAAALADSLPWRSDAHLARCLDAFPGLRILRQPFGETLLAFLCSATKQIVQIKQMLALLAARQGDPLIELSTLDSPLSAPSLNSFHRLPSWPALAAIPESELRSCLLGFRARYIRQTAEFLAVHPGWLDETESLPYAAAKTRLCSLPGVGEKIADCVLLFGAGRLEAFPVDTWIVRAMADRYGLHGWKPAQIAHFGRAHFGPVAGLAQQYLFAFERLAAGHPAPATSVI